MKRAILGSALVIGFLLSGASAPALAAAGANQQCICTKEYAPVMGSDGKTYGNACEAKCAGVEVVGPADDGSTEATGSEPAGNCPKQADPYSP